MYALVVSLLALSSLTHALDVQVRGTNRAFAIEANFRADATAGDEKARARAPGSFRFSYDPGGLTGSLEHRYLRTIFGKRPFTLTEGDVTVRGARRISAEHAGTTGYYLVLAPNDYRVLNGYHAIGIEITEQGEPVERPNVVIFEGVQSRLQTMLQTLIVGRHRYYYRPVVTCQTQLTMPPEVADQALSADAAAITATLTQRRL